MFALKKCDSSVTIFFFSLMLGLALSSFHLVFCLCLFFCFWCVRCSNKSCFCTITLVFCAFLNIFGSFPSRLACNVFYLGLTEDLRKFIKDFYETKRHSKLILNFVCFMVTPFITFIYNPFPDMHWPANNPQSEMDKFHS